MRKWLLLVGLLGCGDDAEEVQSAAAATCERACARAAQASCPNQPRDCAQQCVTQIATSPAGCISVINSYAFCVDTAAYSCNGEGVAEATRCSAELAAWQSCRGGTTIDAGAPQPDATTGLSCAISASEGACDQCLKTECCETLSACSGDCAQLLSCWQTCAEGDMGCTGLCTAQLPNGAPGVQRIYECLARDCSASCADP